MARAAREHAPYSIEQTGAAWRPAGASPGSTATRSTESVSVPNARAAWPTSAAPTVSPSSPSTRTDHMPPCTRG